MLVLQFQRNANVINQLMVAFKENNEEKILSLVSFWMKIPLCTSPDSTQAADQPGEWGPPMNNCKALGSLAKVVRIP